VKQAIVGIDPDRMDWRLPSLPAPNFKILFCCLAGGAWPHGVASPNRVASSPRL